MSTSVEQPQAVSAAPIRTEHRFRITSRRIHFLLVIVGLLITGYMSYSRYASIPLQCVEGGMMNCAAVESSAWSEMRIPVVNVRIATALMGFIAHVILGTILLLEPRVPFLQRYGILLLFGFALFFVMYHTYLIYISVFVLRALCQWCLMAAATMYIHFGVIAWRLRKTLSAG